MDFYTSTEAKQYARNKTRIIKEINDIEQTIAEAVDNNQFSCVVQNTYMTDTRETVEPSRDAKAHCIMQLSKVRVLPYEEGKKNGFPIQINRLNPIQMPHVELADLKHGRKAFTKEEWMESIKKSIAQNPKAIADAQAQLKAERLVIKRGKVVINQ